MGKIERKVIGVVVHLFPDGQMFYVKESEYSQEHGRQIAAYWRNNAGAKYQSPRLLGAVALIRMFEEDYINIMQEVDKVQIDVPPSPKLDIH